MNNTKNAIFIDFSCTHSPIKKMLEPFNDQQELPGDLRILDWLMMVTKVNRLFSFDDIRELLIRTNLLFEASRPIDNWFQEAFLFKYEINSICYHFTEATLYKYAGLIVNENARSYATRENFINEINTTLAYSMLIAALSDFKIKTTKVSLALGPAELSSFYHQHNYSDYFLESKVNQAEYFANNLLSEAPKNLFKGLENGFADKVIELEFKDELRKVVPIFKYKKVDLPIRVQFAKLMLDDNTFLLSFLMDEQACVNHLNFLMHTAWAIANDLLKENEKGEAQYSQFLWNYKREELDKYGIKFPISRLFETYPLEKAFKLVKDLFSTAKFMKMRQQLSDHKY